MMSLEQQQNSGDEEQDDFDETINMVHGTKTEKKPKKKREIDTQPEKGCKKNWSMCQKSIFTSILLHL